ncbi:MAG TPA: hypothetical protein VG276_21030 [Actinomycetes bacterium]|jgi:hypothetical protein|nr:hypothetical protein [Actinomycetes bacterium]
MLLVLCGLDDPGALWFARRAVESGLDCSVVTSEALSYVRRISHQLGRDGVHTTVELIDGTVLVDELAAGPGGVSGVLNRMLEPPAQAWQYAAPAERDYAAMELHAVVLSWLHGLRCPVRNRPEPDCLAGPVRHPFVAVAAAHAVGLSCPTVRFDSAAPLWPADALLAAAAAAAGRPARAVHVVCLDGEVLAPEVPEAVAGGVAAFTTRIGAGEALIGVDFVVGPSGWWFAGLTPLADLRAGGAVLFDRLIELLVPGLMVAVP